MCPFCLATVVLITAGATSLAGLVPLAAQKLKPQPVRRESKEPHASERAAQSGAEGNR